MTRLNERLGSGWRRADPATRLWWSGVAAVGLAGTLLIGGVAVAGTVHASSPSARPTGTGSSEAMGSGPSQPSNGPPSAGQGPASSMSMPGSGSTGAMTSPGSSICPNVQGATVMSNGMVMAPVPSTPPTPAQQAAADNLVASVEQGIVQYDNVQVAEADGYQPLSAARGPMTHYLNRSVVKQGDVLDPSHPSALMFANTVDGPVLIGAMFLGPAPCQPGPDIGGSLTQWHAHDDLCTSGSQLAGKTGADGTCAVGTHRDTTYFMLHVWTAPQLAAQYQFEADLPPSAYTAIDESGPA